MRPESHIEKLIGEQGYKFRVGDYRALLDLNKNDKKNHQYNVNFSFCYRNCCLFLL